MPVTSGAGNDAADGNDGVDGKRRDAAREHRARRRIRIGVDTGGTFTDAVAIDEASGRITTTKTPTTPADPAEAFLAAVRKVLALLGARGADVAAISHGTTVATNALLEGRLGRLGFITTEGFESILEIARQSVPDGYGNSYFWIKPDRIVPADLVRTVGGRLGARGDEVRPFDEAGAVAVARWFRERGVDTLGVCFLHSYANPAHEQRMRAVLRREHPRAVVSISSDVLREYREYERSIATLVDAAVKPQVASYVSQLRDRLAEMTAGDDAVVPFHVMQSNGGVLSAAEVARQPIRTVLSGPAAGALGAALLAQRAGIERVLTLDGGGTSTDVAVVLDGEPALTTEGVVGGYPSRIPMIDLVTVGAGGGSVAEIKPDGGLRVGPRSAGADPGPQCYGRGGQEPTVTDAHLVLGRIPPALLGGEITLDLGAARRGLMRVGRQLGLPLERVAAGVLEISAWNQANALREVTVARGLDVRDFTLVAFGGSGPLLACRLVELLGLRGVVVPRDPGNVSAFGLLTVDVRTDVVRTTVARAADLDLTVVAATLTGMERQAAAALDAEGFEPDRQRLERSADLRYFGQAFEVRVPGPPGAVDAAWAATVEAAFHDAHEALYGYAFRPADQLAAAGPAGSPAGGSVQSVEWVNLRVTGIGRLRRPELPELPEGPTVRGAAAAERARVGQRAVCFDVGTTAGEDVGGPVLTPIYARDRLPAAGVLKGPAIIEEFGSTVPLPPTFQAEVDRLGNLLITRVPS